MTEMIWLFLKSNWKWIAVVLLIISLLGYIETIKLERDHYKNKVVAIQTELDNLVTSSAIKQKKLQADVTQITDKYKSTLHDANTLVTENAKLNGENIAKDKELASVKLSLNAVRLFNASKQSTSEQDSSSTSEQGNDGTTTSLAKALEEKSQTLADLLQVVNINDANHLKCIKTVDQWQKFWSDYETAVEKVNAGNN